MLFRMAEVAPLSVNAWDMSVKQLGWNSIEIVDVIDPATPRWVGRTSLHAAPQGRGLAVLDPYVYLADVGLRVLDLSDPAAPRDVVTVELPPQARNGGGVAVDARTSMLYFASAGLFAYDLADPSAPRMVSGRLEEETYDSNIRVGDGIAFVFIPRGFLPSKLYAFSLRDPARPQRFRRAIVTGARRGFTSACNTVSVSSLRGSCASTLTTMQVNVRQGLFR